MKSKARSLLSFSFHCAAFALPTILAACILYLTSQPDIHWLKNNNPPETAFMHLRARQARGNNRPYRKMQTWTPLSRISTHLPNAVIVAEDASFYQHDGFDFVQLREALKRDWERGELAYGGSTITQQLAKNLYLSPSKNPLRKLKESIIAWRLDRDLSKKRILELYLNVVEWGPGVYGAQAASQYHFGKNAADLTPEEAATLATWLPSPLRYSKNKDSRYVARMVKTILIRMKARRFLPEDYPLDG